MGIKIENINLKKDDKFIFENLTVTIPYKKIIGLCGNKKDEFINLLKTKDFNTGKLLDDDDFLINMLVVDNYDDFVTNYILDELVIKINYDNEKQIEIEDILRKFDLDNTYINQNINNSSILERKLLKIIIAMYSSSKTIVFIDLFDGIGYRNKMLLIKLLKKIKKNYNKTIIICDNDMDCIENLVDYLLIVDSNLVVIDHIDDIFNNENIDKVDIEYPNLIKIKKILEKKGKDTKDIKSISDLLRK